MQKDGSSSNSGDDQDDEKYCDTQMPIGWQFTYLNELYGDMKVNRMETRKGKIKKFVKK